MAQRFGFLCCGPSAERNVYYSSDEDSSEDELGLADSRIVRLPGEKSARSASRERQPLIDARGNKAAKVRERVALLPLPQEPSFLDRLAGNWKDLQSTMFSPRPAGQQRSGLVSLLVGSDEDEGAGQAGGVSDETALNLAFKETHRLPDVAGEEKVLWAAGKLRIDLTETGIRTLRGLDSFPNVHTLVLDRNGLLSLPLDCPWVPSLETLWLCNNEIENLDGLLCQVNDVFPRLTSLALMGNPVWPAAKVRARAGGAPVSVASDGQKYASGSSASSKSYKGGVVAGMEAAGRGGGGGEGAELGLEGQEEAAYRLHVVRRLPGLLTLDCTDVSEEERANARKGDPADRLVDVTALLLEQEPMTDVEESLPRDTPPGSTKSVSHGVGKMLDHERERRLNLPDRSTLPSTWYKDAIVMDVGSGWTKMGLAGEDKPACVFPSVVGRVDLRQYDRISGQDERVYVGYQAVEEATKRAADRDLPDGRGPMPKPILLQQPMSSGIVTDWDDMEQLWRHGIEQEMGLDPVEHPVLMADSTATAPGEREKATEVLFETMTTPALHMALQPVLALYACGPSSGLVVDIGDSGTQVAPIFDGFVLERGVRQLNLGGKDVTRQLGALVNAKVGLLGGEDFEPDDPCDALQLEALKANMCFVSENIDQDNAKMELSMTKSYTLPDGTRVSLGRERYRAPELLFDPGMALRQEESLQNTVLDAILACERKTWPVLAQTVILTGGSTEMFGLNRRLQRELTKTSRASGIRLKFTVMVPEDDHNNTVWVGGSMLASTGALDGLWFTRAEYEEYGAGPIHAKFAA